MHAWLQPMQARISSASPCSALAGSSGSQISARVMPTMSAWPLASTCSPSCGWLMRPATMTGTLTACLTCSDNGATYAGAKLIGGRDVVRAGQGRRRPGDDADVVERAVRVERAQGVEHLIDLEPVVGLLARRDPKTDDELTSDVFADRRDHLTQETQPVLERPAVGVVANVRRAG